VALCLGDPAGDPKRYGPVVDSFGELCYQNDWLPAYVHIQESHRKLYETRGFALQKLGQEAVVDLAHFEASVVGNKYFRHIRNKFTKQGYTAELLQPPHHQAVLNRLHDISNDWLERGGRVERGFAMGYYSDEYMQACPIMVVRDAAGTIQAFVNQLPASFDTKEATYDLLRNTQSSLGNITDFLLIHFAAVLREAGYTSLNLGLCPLTGLDNVDDDDRSGLIHNMLRFTFANGDRLYSFSGLYRFKAKYEPEWRDRYIAYQGGVRGFTRSVTALMRTMRVKK
jgi:phosphatidylglycerol lysyltransferase